MADERKRQFETPDQGVGSKRQRPDSEEGDSSTAETVRDSNVSPDREFQTYFMNLINTIETFKQREEELSAIISDKYKTFFSTVVFDIKPNSKEAVKVTDNAIEIYKAETATETLRLFGESISKIEIFILNSYDLSTKVLSNINE